MRILVADDDEVFAGVLADSLNDKGHEAEMVLRLADILPRLAEQEFDVLLLDLMMGEESSMSLIGDIKAFDEAVKVVVLTGYASVASTVQALKLGAANYLAKPVGIREVLAILDDESVTRNEDLQPMPLHRLEWEHIQRVLAEHDGNISATARALGIHRRTLQRKLDKRPPR